MIFLSSSLVGVSKAILDGAGQAVEAECQTLGKETFTSNLHPTIFLLGNEMNKANH